MILIKANRHLTIWTGFVFSFQNLYSIGRSYSWLSNYIGFSSPPVILKIYLFNTWIEHQLECGFEMVQYWAHTYLYNITEWYRFQRCHLLLGLFTCFEITSMPHYCNNNNNNNNNNSTILIFWSPKLLRSSSLEHKTSMDIERIVVGESMLSILIWLPLVQYLYQILDY